jgi:hypothetical protein
MQGVVENKQKKYVANEPGCIDEYVTNWLNVSALFLQSL